MGPSSGHGWNEIVQLTLEVHGSKQVDMVGMK